LLARREHSEFEIRRKLLLKGFEAQIVDEALEILTLKGQLSNQRFVQAYINYRRDNGYGPNRIHVELSARGIPEDMIDHHLDIADNAWFLEAEKVWRKRFKGLIPADFKARAQQMRFLQYRGFTPDHIEKIYHSDIEHA
jgi:regulatory protein